MASDYKTIAALGRPFTLGMLYDSQRNKLIPGTTLWDDKTLREKTCESPQLGSEFQITSSDSAEDKSNSLGVEASLGVSFLFGLVDVSGSAKYLYDYKTFKNQSRVILQYKATTHYKQLSMTPDEIKNIQLPGVIETGLATHVVVGILYGANAFFVFDSERLDSDSVHDYHGKMGAVIRKIPICSVYGEVDINLTPEEKSLTEKFSCKFYGDILLQHNPTTFQEALSAYAKLPQLLHSNGDNAVPLRVWLMPLTNLDSKAPKLNREITVGVVRKAQEAVEDLRQMEMRCNDSLEDRVVGNCPPIQKELKCFQKTCNYYQSKLQKMLEDNLLGHTGEGKEAEEQLFENREKSPFSHEKLSKWLNNKEREINVIKSCVEMMEGKKMEIETKIKMVPNQSALDREVLAPGVDHVLCYVFTSLENNDRYLKELAEYTDAFKLCELKSINAFPLAENTCAILYTPEWYFTDNVITKMREKARAFHGLAKALKNNSRFSFCVAAIANEDHEGATIYHYKNGILVTDNFSVPEISDPESIKDRNALIWYTCELTLDPSTVNGYLTLSDDNKEVTHGDWQKYSDLPERFDKCLQVLCKEGLTGRHYWEIEWSGCCDAVVGVAVTYKGICRKGDNALSNFEKNSTSWFFGKNDKEFTLSDTLKNDQSIPFPPAGCKRLGVYLDWPEGTLSFYSVTYKTLSHLYTVRNLNFSEPVHPGFMVKNHAYVKLCSVEI